MQEIASEIMRDELESLVGKEKFRHLYSKCRADTSTVLTPQQVQSILEDREVDTDKMVPERMWMVNAWEPYGMSVSNYKRMIKEKVVVTRDSQSQQVGAISLSDIFKGGRGISYLIHFYSIPRGVDSLPLVKAHFLRHLLLVKERQFTDTINIWLLVPDDATLERIKLFLFDEGHLGMKRNTSPDLVDSTDIN